MKLLNSKARYANEVNALIDLDEFVFLQVFQVELEYSLAFRLLIYRVEIPSSNSKDTPLRSVCIGRFHRDVKKNKQFLFLSNQ